MRLRTTQMPSAKSPIHPCPLPMTICKMANHRTRRILIPKSPRAPNRPTHRRTIYLRGMPKASPNTITPPRITHILRMEPPKHSHMGFSPHTTSTPDNQPPTQPRVHWPPLETPIWSPVIQTPIPWLPFRPRTIRPPTIKPPTIRPRELLTIPDLIHRVSIHPRTILTPHTVKLAKRFIFNLTPTTHKPRMRLQTNSILMPAHMAQPHTTRMSALGEACWIRASSSWIASDIRQYQTSRTKLSNKQSR
jgi:hypothetical protein